MQASAELLLGRGVVAASPDTLERSILYWQYVALVAFVLLLYDIIISFDQEVTHIYGGRASIVQLLWFFRILVPVQLGVHALPTYWLNPPTWLCLVMLQHFDVWLGVVNLFTIQCLLALRTVAIYERSLKVSVFITILMVGSFASRLVIIIMSVLQFPDLKPFHVPNGTQLCLTPPVQISRNRFSAWCGPAIVDIVLYLMTVWRLYTRSPRSVPGIRRSNSLFSLLYRDGSIYFLVVAAALTITMIGFFNVYWAAAFSASDLYIATCSIACSRLILHLKERSKQAISGFKNPQGSWDPGFKLEVTKNATDLTRSEIVIGFGYDLPPSPPPMASSHSGEIESRSFGQRVDRPRWEGSFELRSLSQSIA